MKATMTYVPSRLGEGFFVDVPVPGSGDNAKALTYDHGTGAFVYTAFDASGTAAAAVAAHVALSDPHTQYELEANNTASAILTKLLTVDGAGSGLDADLLDGNSSAAFLLASGATIGAVSSRQVFTSGITAPTIRPASDSTAAVIIQSAAGDNIISIDSTHKTVAIATATNPNRILSINPGVSLASAPQIGIYDAIVVGTGGNNAAWGLFGQIYYASSVNQNGLLYGAQVQVVNASTGLIANAQGGNFSVVASAGNTTIATGGSFSVQNTGNGTMGTAFGGVFGVSKTAGSIGVAYGIYVSDVLAASTNYAIYTNVGDVRLMSSNSDKIGFHGVTPVARQTLATGAGATVDNVITALQNLGLVKQS